MIGVEIGEDRHSDNAWNSHDDVENKSDRNFGYSEMASANTGDDVCPVCWAVKSKIIRYKIATTDGGCVNGCKDHAVVF